MKPTLETLLEWVSWLFCRQGRCQIGNVDAHYRLMRMGFEHGSAQTPLTRDLPELRIHRHRRALSNILAARLCGFDGFQSWITTNEDGGNRADSASNESEEEGVIHAHRQSLLSNAGMKSG